MDYRAKCHTTTRSSLPLSTPDELKRYGHHLRRVCCQSLTLFLIVAVAGCAPLPMQVYVPNAPGGNVLFSPCTLNTHLPIGISVSAAGVEAVVSLAKHGGREYVELRLEIPEGKTLALQESTIQLDTADPQSSRRIELPAVSLVDTPIVNINSAVPDIRQRQLPTMAPLVGGQVVAGRLSSGRYFWLATYVETASAKDVWLTLPRVTINGVLSSFPQLHFHRQPVIAIALFNC